MSGRVHALRPSDDPEHALAGVREALVDGATGFIVVRQDAEGRLTVDTYGAITLGAISLAGGLLQQVAVAACQGSTE